MPNLPKQPKPRNQQAPRQAWAEEHAAPRRARTVGDTTGEWHHHDRAHIVSQSLPVAHLRAPVAMLGYGIPPPRPPQVVGQVVRLVVAGPGSAVGLFLLWNTGANVNAVTSMPIPDDLQAVIDGTTTASS